MDFGDRSDIRISRGSRVAFAALLLAEPVDKEWRMSAFQARVGLGQIKGLQQNIGHRRALGKFYGDYLGSHGWELARTPEHSDCTFLRYPIRVANKWELLSEAAGARIELGSWFESTLHPIRTSLERFGYHQRLCPVAEQTADEILNLPMHPRVSVEEAERIADFVCKEGKRPAPKQHA